MSSDSDDRYELPRHALKPELRAADRDTKKKLKVKLATVLKALADDEEDEEIQRRLRTKAQHMQEKVERSATARPPRQMQGLRPAATEPGPRHARHARAGRAWMMSRYRSIHSRATPAATGSVEGGEEGPLQAAQAGAGG